MFDAASGLTDVKTDDLKKLLAAVHRATITCPLTMDELARHGLQHCGEGARLGRRIRDSQAQGQAQLTGQLPGEAFGVQQRQLALHRYPQLDRAHQLYLGPGAQQMRQSVG